MSKLEQDFTIFGDYYFNSTREKINKLALEFKKYSQEELMVFLKNKMQDIIVHLLGCTTFDDAIMISSPKKSYYYLVNNAKGRKKLTEFFAFLEEIDKIEQFHNLDKEHFKDNENDQVLAEYEKTKEATEKIYLQYLHVDSITDFFATIITIMENETFNMEIKEMVTIPDPTSFDFNIYYYIAIDTMKFIGDEKNNKRVREKHKEDGKSIDARKWIKGYQNRFDIIIPQEFETNGISDSDIETITRVVKEQQEEIRKMKFALIAMRYEIQQIMKKSGETITEKELDTYENVYILEKIANIANKPLNTKKDKTLKGILYTTILLTTLSFGTNKIIENANQQFKACEQKIQREISKENPNLEIPNENLNTETPKDNEEKVGNLLTTPYLPNQENPVNTNEDLQNYKPFQIGEIINLENNPVYYYDTAFSSKPISVTQDKEGIVIGYYAIQQQENKNTLIKSLKTQEEVENFRKNYDTSSGELIWRCAINVYNIEQIKQMIANNQKISSDYATYFIDYQEKTLSLNEEAKVTK